MRFYCANPDCSHKEFDETEFSQTTDHLERTHPELVIVYIESRLCPGCFFIEHPNLQVGCGIET